MPEKAVNNSIHASGHHLYLPQPRKTPFILLIRY